VSVEKMMDEVFISKLTRALKVLAIMDSMGDDTPIIKHKTPRRSEAQQLRHYRIEVLGMTQGELSHKLKTCKTEISKAETGRNIPHLYKKMDKKYPGWRIPTSKNVVGHNRKS
jgi:DNA-binding XRE family transcriptional regulator